MGMSLPQSHPPHALSPCAVVQVGLPEPLAVPFDAITTMTPMKPRLVWIFAIALSLLLWQWHAAQSQQSIFVRVDRWLQLQQMSGNVQYFRTGNTRRARVGDRLTAVGDGVRTTSNSSGTLSVDTGVGIITLRENTELRVRNLDFAPDNGRVTHLYVPQGQVILNLRRFTHTGSELEIETPSGVSGVRGTEFGVNVHPDGTTGVATRSGQVDTQAQRITVEVQAGFQTLVRPGEPPLAPTPIPDRPVFDYRIEPIVRSGQRRLMLIGRIDPINQVYVEGEQQTVNYWGEFSYEVVARFGRTLRVTIVTPLGDEVDYDISLL